MVLLYQINYRHDTEWYKNPWIFMFDWIYLDLSLVIFASSHAFLNRVEIYLGWFCEEIWLEIDKNIYHMKTDVLLIPLYY